MARAVVTLLIFVSAFLPLSWAGWNDGTSFYRAVPPPGVPHDFLGPRRYTGSTSVPAVWPLPSSYSLGEDVVVVDAHKFSFHASGYMSDTLHAAFDRYSHLLFPPLQGGEGKAPPPHGTLLPARDEHDASVLVGLDVNVLSHDMSLTLDTDESYTLDIEAPVAHLICHSVYGAIRGLETFSQLVVAQDDHLAYIIRGVPVHIDDAPRYAHRGLLVDTSRHYLEKDLLLANLDAMNYNKLNVLHWHVVDDQSFPLESTTYPLLSQKGAYKANQVFSPADIEEIVEYGRLRAIRVVPEFDVPAHTSSWMAGYPHLRANCPDSYGAMDPTKETTYEFLQNFFLEMSKRFPDAYFHLGGDEVSFGCWKADPQITQWMKDHNMTEYSKLEEYFEQKVMALVHGVGKGFVVWQEIFNNGLTVRNDTVIEVWKGLDYDTLDAVVKSGLRAILSGCWYLDHLTDAWDTYYACEPSDGKLTPEQEKLIVGGEACMWGEQVDRANFLSRVYPRVSAVAERLWSPKGFPPPATDGDEWSNVAPRLHEHVCRMRRRDIWAEPIGVGWGFASCDWE